MGFVYNGYNYLVFTSETLINALDGIGQNSPSNIPGLAALIDASIVAQGQVLNCTTVNTASYTPLSTDCSLQVTYTVTGAVAINLPALSTTDSGRTYWITDSGYNSATSNITISPNGSDKVNNTTSATISTNGATVRVKANTSTGNWEIV